MSPGMMPVPVIPSLDDVRKRLAMTKSPLSPEIIEWGATLTTAKPEEGETYWRLHMAQGPMDIGGNHHIYVDVWDENGNRLVGVPVMFYSVDERWEKPTEAKSGEQHAVDFPMYAGGHAYGVYIDGIKSDALWGLGMPDHKPHHSFRVTFQRTKRAFPVTAPPPLPPPPTTGPPHGEVAVTAYIHLLDGRVTNITWDQPE